MRSGYSTNNDNAKLIATFLNGSGMALGSATTGPVLAADRNGISGMVQRSKAGNLPVGTRSISVVIAMSRVDGTINDATADDLSLILTKG